MLFSGALASAQTVTVPKDVVGKLRGEARITYIRMPWGVTPHNEEYAAAVQPDGSVLYFELGVRGGYFRVPSATVLLLHTHPVMADIKPTNDDFPTARKLGVPNCVVTADQIWCVLPDGKIERGIE